VKVAEAEALVEVVLDVVPTVVLVETAVTTDTEVVVVLLITMALEVVVAGAEVEAAMLLLAVEAIVMPLGMTRVTPADRQRPWATEIVSERGSAQFWGQCRACVERTASTAVALGEPAARHSNRYGELARGCRTYLRYQLLSKRLGRRW
jgi:hypothetical protein